MGHLSCCMTMAVNYKRRNATLGIPRGREGTRQSCRRGKGEQSARQTPYDVRSTLNIEKRERSLIQQCSLFETFEVLSLDQRINGIIIGVDPLCI